MKLIEITTYLVGFRRKNSSTIITYKAIEGNNLTEAMEIAKEYANKLDYVIAIIKENDTNILRRLTKTINY